MAVWLPVWPRVAAAAGALWLLLGDGVVGAANAGTAPEQRHLSLAGPGQMAVEWVTPQQARSVVVFGTAEETLEITAEGSSEVYSCGEKKCGGPYTSGRLHRAVLGESGQALKPGVRYFYRCGGEGDGEVFSFVMPGASLPSQPAVIALVGDLGQTVHTEQTIEHIRKADPLLTLVSGDLAYADCDQPRWDSYGRVAEPLAARVPVMTVAGNHEMETPHECGASMNTSFAAYNARYRNPSAASGSGSNLYYSFESAGVHFLMLCSYTDFSAGSKQLAWLQSDLAKVDRKLTPWLVAVLHAPWYNSNFDHKHESEEYKMRESMEKLLRDAQLDAMFAGHVHAYERVYRVFDGKLDACAPAYFNVGAGGNREGLSRHFMGKPDWSAVHDAGYGHSLLTVHNATHAHFTWHRDQADERKIFDEFWLTKDPQCAVGGERKWLFDWLFV